MCVLRSTPGTSKTPPRTAKKPAKNNTTTSTDKADRCHDATHRTTKRLDEMGTATSDQTRQDQMDATDTHNERCVYMYLRSADVFLSAQQDPPIGVRQQPHERRRPGGQVPESPGEAVLEGLQGWPAGVDEDQAGLGRHVLRLVAVRYRTLGRKERAGRWVSIRGEEPREHTRYDTAAERGLGNNGKGWPSRDIVETLASL